VPRELSMLEPLAPADARRQREVGLYRLNAVCPLALESNQASTFEPIK
jgi:hypothetical protein